jgi:hypothetical protein
MNLISHSMKKEIRKEEKMGVGPSIIMMRYHAGSDVKKEDMSGAKVPVSDRSKRRRSDG